MISLKQLQQSFQAYVLQDDQTILSNVIDSTQISAQSRMDIYRDAYYLRLIEILAMDYPMLKDWLKEPTFKKIAREYIEVFPSHNFSVRVFGQHLSKFLAQSNSESMLAELAAFEWKLAEVLDAADGPTMAIEDMAKIPPDAWGSMQLFLHPSLQVTSFFSNAAEIWKALNENKKKPKIIYSTEPMFHMFWRKDQDAYFMPLNPAQIHMLNAIREKKSFGEICEELCEILPEEEVIQFAAGTMRNWIHDGVISEISLQSEET